MHAPAFRSVQSLSLAGLCLIAAACGGTDSTPTLDTATAEDIGSQVSSTVALAAANFTGPNINSLLAAPAFRALARVSGAPNAPSIPMPANPNCPTASSTTDTDVDGIPDNAVLTYTAGNCTITDVNGTTVITGSVLVVDNGFGFSVGYTSLKVAFTPSGGTTYSVTINGSSALTGSGAGATIGQTLAFLVRIGTRSASLSESWQVAFTPTAGSIVPGSPLPAGTLDVNGSYAFSSAGRSYAFSIVTVDPLVYDPACAGQATPFTGGELRAKLVGTRGAVYVRVLYGPACDQETVIAVGTTA